MKQQDKQQLRSTLIDNIKSTEQEILQLKEGIARSRPMYRLGG